MDQACIKYNFNCHFRWIRDQDGKNQTASSNGLDEIKEVIIIKRIGMKIKVVNQSPFSLPEYATEHSAGLDLKANITDPIVLKPLARIMVPTGLFIELPEGFEAQVRPRSGLAAKHGISIVNSPGTIDPDYRGEIKVILINLSEIPFMLNPGERIAQMVIARFEHIQWNQVEELSQTTRGEGGFGHTGTH